MSEDFREPNFSSEEDMFVIATDEKVEKDSLDGLSLKANILLFSYNRPKMLRQAITSILEQDYGNFDLYIVDDGSELFEPMELVDEFSDSRILVAQAPKISLEQRVKESRLARNANAVIKIIPNDEPIYYLCDDDLMAKKWLSRSIRAFQDVKDIHVVTGQAWYFNDGEDPYTEAKYGMPIDAYKSMPTVFWSTGSFAHRAYCSKVEGIWWTDNTHGHSQDTNFITDFWNTHSNYAQIETPALLRREHDNTLSAKLGRKDETGKYAVGYIPPPATEEMYQNLE